jgi:hypothetical protein
MLSCWLSPAITLIACDIDQQSRFQRIRQPKRSLKPKSGFAKILSSGNRLPTKRGVRYPG